MAHPSKKPRGGAGLLFLAGFGLEVVVVLVALRTVLADFVSEGLPAVRKEEAKASAPWEPVPATAVPAVATPPANPGSVADVQADIGAAIGPAATICWALAEPTDAGALMVIKVQVAADGTVSGAEVAGVSGPLAACVEAEATQWRLTAPGQPTQIVKSVRFD